MEKSLLETIMIQENFGPAKRHECRIASVQGSAKTRSLNSLERFLYYYADGTQVINHFCELSQSRIKSSDTKALTNHEKTIASYQFAVVEGADTHAQNSGWHVMRAVSIGSLTPTDQNLSNNNPLPNPFG